MEALQIRISRLVPQLSIMIPGATSNDLLYQNNRKNRTQLTPWTLTNGLLKGRDNHRDKILLNEVGFFIWKGI